MILSETFLQEDTVVTKGGAVSGIGEPVGTQGITGEAPKTLGQGIHAFCHGSSGRSVFCYFRQEADLCQVIAGKNFFPGRDSGSGCIFGI